MDPFLDTLDAVTAMLESCVGTALRASGLRAVSDTDLIAVMSSAAGVIRRLEAVLIEGAGEVSARSAAAAREDRLSTRYDCANPSELIQRTTRCASGTASEYLRSASMVREGTALTTGELLPPILPALREVMVDGETGRDGLLAASGPLRDIADRVPAESLHLADAALAAIARGEGVQGAPAATAAELKMHAQAFAVLLDEDGAEPRDAAAMRRRGVTLGMARDGLVPITGRLLPEVAAQLSRLFDSLLNPKAEGPAAPRGAASAGVGAFGAPRPYFTSADDGTGSPESVGEFAADDLRTNPDVRSRTQKLHDALATVLTVAARSGELPTLGGSAPTLVVSVREDDLENSTGYAHIHGIAEPISLTFARQIACEGGIFRVTHAKNGRIISLHTQDRVFSHHQRKAITLRDGGCIIPGCAVRAEWCELHHVQEHARGGPTQTDNGVLLCWHHHRTLDACGWAIRMRRGIPEVRGPSWWDPNCRWRPSTKSRVRMLNDLDKPPD